MTRNAETATPRRSRRAFSLVELLVAISIIALLVGMVAAGFGAFRTEAQRRQTAGLLQNLHSIANEYQAITGRSYDPLDSGCLAPDADPNDLYSAYTECFIDEMWTLEETRRMIDHVGDYLRVCEDGMTMDGEVVGSCDPNDPDDWREREFIDEEHLDQDRGRMERPGDGYPHDSPTDRITMTIVDRWGKPVRYFSSNANNDLDFEPSMPRHHRPFFASAGPDQAWGAFTNGQPNSAAADNLYSFDLD